ncbi:MAG: toll/interleukin-1 receptor domain-containing protein [Planctomycetes bacterium]|nr:toll/interleukin-1 receptor domain-containing protein [Planctomycetota bacterium]
MKTQPDFDVFLSHNSIDKPWVVRLKDALFACGLQVWLDHDEIRPGDLFVNSLALLSVFIPSA